MSTLRETGRFSKESRGWSEKARLTALVIEVEKEIQDIHERLDAFMGVEKKPHNVDCDIDPVTAKPKEELTPGDLLWVCSECADFQWGR